MKQPTQEQIKELWEKLKPKPKDWDEYNRWLYYGYPPIDLNNLFKYAPEYQQVIFQLGYCGITKDDKLYEGNGDTEAEALFGAWCEVRKDD